jgi:chromosome segregation ATPase
MEGRGAMEAGYSSRASEQEELAGVVRDERDHWRQEFEGLLGANQTCEHGKRLQGQQLWEMVMDMERDRERLQALGGELHAVKERLAISLVKEKDLQEKIMSANGENDTLRRQVTEQSELIDRLVHERGQNLGQIELLNTEKATMGSSMEGLQGQLQKLSQEAIEHNNRFSELQDTKNRIESEKTTLQTQLDKLTQQLADLNANSSEVIQNLTSQLDSLKAEHSSVVENLKKQLEEVTKENLINLNAITQMEADAQLKKTEFEQLEGTLRAEVQAIGDQLVEEKNKNTDLGKEVSELKSKLEGLTAANESLKKDHDTMGALIEEFKTKVQQSEVKEKDLEAKVQSIEVESAKRLEESELENKSLLNEIQQLISKNTESASKDQVIDNLKDEIKVISEENLKKLSENEAQASQLKDLALQIAQLTEAKVQLEGQNENLTQELQAKVHKITDLENTLKEKEGVIANSSLSQSDQVKQIEERDKTIHALEGQKVSKNEEIAKLNSDLDKEVSRKQALEANLTDITAEADRLAALISANNAEQVQTQPNAGDKTREQEELSKEIEELKGVITDLQIKLKGKDDQLEVSTAMAPKAIVSGESSSELQNALNQIASLNKELEERGKIVDAQHARILELETKLLHPQPTEAAGMDNQEKLNEITSLQTKLDQRAADLDNKEKGLNLKEQMLRSIEETLNRREAELGAHNEQLDKSLPLDGTSTEGPQSIRHIATGLNLDPDIIKAIQAREEDLNAKLLELSQRTKLIENREKEVGTRADEIEQKLKEAETEKVVSQLKQKEVELQEQLAKVAHEQAEKLVQEAKSKQHEIDEREKKLQALDAQIQKASEELALREKQLESAQRAITEEQEALAKRTALLSEGNSQNIEANLLERETSLTQKEAELRNRQKEVEDKLAESSILSTNLEGREQQLETQREELRLEKARLNELLTKNQNAAEQIKIYENELASKDAQLKIREQSLHDREVALTSRQKDLDSRESNFNSKLNPSAPEVTQPNSNKRDSVTSRERILMAREGDLKGWESDLESREIEAHLHSLETSALIQLLEETINELKLLKQEKGMPVANVDPQIAQREKELQDISSQLNARRLSLAAREAAITQMQRNADEREGILRMREQELNLRQAVQPEEQIRHQARVKGIVNQEGEPEQKLDSSPSPSQLAKLAEIQSRLIEIGSREDGLRRKEAALEQKQAELLRREAMLMERGTPELSGNDTESRLALREKDLYERELRLGDRERYLNDREARMNSSSAVSSQPHKHDCAQCNDHSKLLSENKQLKEELMFVRRLTEELRTDVKRLETGPKIDDKRPEWAGQGNFIAFDSSDKKPLGQDAERVIQLERRVGVLENELAAKGSQLMSLEEKMARGDSIMMSPPDKSMRRDEGSLLMDRDFLARTPGADATTLNETIRTLTDKNRKLVENMKEYDALVKKVEKELAKSDETKKTLLAYLEQILGPIYGGARLSNTTEVQLKVDTHITKVKKYEERVRALEDAIEQEKNKTLEESIGRIRSQPTLISQPPRGSYGPEPIRGTSSSFRAINGTRYSPSKDRDNSYYGHSPADLDNTRPLYTRDFSPLGESAGRRSRGASPPDKDKTLYDHRRQHFHCTHEEYSDLRGMLQKLISGTREPDGLEARETDRYYRDMLVKIELKLEHLVARFERNSQNLQGYANNKRSQEELPRHPSADYLQRGGLGSIHNRSQSHFVNIDINESVNSYKMAGVSPIPSRSRSPFSNAGLFKGVPDKPYYQGIYKNPEEEDRSRSRRDERDRNSPFRIENIDGLIRAESPEGLKEEVIIDDFLNSLRYILSNISRMKLKCQSIKSSYEMIDNKVFDMLRYIQKNNPQAEVICQLMDFLSSSSLSSISASVEKMSTLDSLCYKRAMNEFESIYLKLKDQTEDLKKTIDLRRASLNSIMCKKNIFHN